MIIPIFHRSAWTTILGLRWFAGSCCWPPPYRSTHIRAHTHEKKLRLERTTPRKKWLLLDEANDLLTSTTILSHNAPSIIRIKIGGFIPYANEQQLREGRQRCNRTRTRHTWKKDQVLLQDAERRDLKDRDRSGANGANDGQKQRKRSGLTSRRHSPTTSSNASFRTKRLVERRYPGKTKHSS